MNSVSSFFDPVQRQFSAVLDEEFWTKGKVITVSAVIGVLGAFMAYRLCGGFFNAVPFVPKIPHTPIDPNLVKNVAHKTCENFSAVQNFFSNGTCPAVAKTTSLCEGFFNAVPCVPEITYTPIGTNITQNLAHKTCENFSAVQNFFSNGTGPAVAKTITQITSSLGVPPGLPIFRDYYMRNSLTTVVGNPSALQPAGLSLEEGLEIAGTVVKTTAEGGAVVALEGLKMVGTAVKTSFSWTGKTLNFFLLKNQELTIFGGAIAYAASLIFRGMRAGRV
jgi:hypothetical protein